MTENTSQPVDAAAMRRRSRIFKMVNVPMRAVLSLPFPTPLSRNLMLVRYTGRKSGRVYRQPLSYARDGEALLTPGGGRWTLNMEGGRPVRIRLRGRDVSARPELVRDPGEVERLLDVIVRRRTRPPPGTSRSPGRPTAVWSPPRSRPRSTTASRSSAGTSFPVPGLALRAIASPDRRSACRYDAKQRSVQC